MRARQKVATVLGEIVMDQLLQDEATCPNDLLWTRGLLPDPWALINTDDIQSRPFEIGPGDLHGVLAVDGAMCQEEWQYWRKGGWAA
eukprot:10917344-Prorocentrum_lima.AAC.1